MRLPTRPTARRQAPAAQRPAPLHRNGRSCRWSSSAKRILDPNQPLRAGRPLHGDYVEAHRAGSPTRLPLQKKAGGAYDFALLAPRNRLQRSAELLTAALPHLDDRQHLTVETDQIELAGLAPEIARQDFQPARLQEIGRE